MCHAFLNRGSPSKALAQGKFIPGKPCRSFNSARQNLPDRQNLPGKICRCGKFFRLQPAQPIEMTW